MKVGEWGKRETSGGNLLFEKVGFSEKKTSARLPPGQVWVSQ